MVNVRSESAAMKSREHPLSGKRKAGTHGKVRSIYFNTSGNNSSISFVLRKGILIFALITI